LRTGIWVEKDAFGRLVSYRNSYRDSLPRIKRYLFDRSIR